MERRSFSKGNPADADMTIGPGKVTSGYRDQWDEGLEDAVYARHIYTLRVPSKDARRSDHVFPSESGRDIEQGRNG